MSLISWRAMPRVLGAASFAAALAWSSTAAAAPSCAAGETSASFSYTGSDQTVVVPANVTSATVYLLGAQGAAGTNGGGYTAGTGGPGAQVSGRMTVIPSQTLTIGVGGQGQLTVNPGGQGAINGVIVQLPASVRAGNGGGGTDVRIGATRVAIAGGGGGGGNPGWGGSTPVNGGNGGASGSPGANGGDVTTPSSFSGTGPSGGKGGTVGTGGAAGNGCSFANGTAGTAAGAGGSAPLLGGGWDGNGNGGGGGGGATVGGGGGGGSAGTTTCIANITSAGGGGAGGASSTGTLTNASVTEGANTGNGSALICFAPPEYTISGTGSSNLGPVTLELTGSAPTQTLVVPANAASFAFPTSLPDSSTWNVAVTAKPANQTCSVTPSSGTLAGANVTNLVLACQTITAQTQSLTTVSGATATVSLEQGATGGPFTSAAITGNTNPAAGTASIIQVGGVQTLQFTAAANFVGTLTVNYTLSNATATTAQATVNITVNPSRFNVGGTGSSALGSVTLELTSTEAAQTLVVPANASSFTFPTGVLNNTAFQVAVTAKPSNQTCTVTPSSGTVAGAAITNLVLACQTITAQTQSLTTVSGTTATVSLQTGATGGPFTSAAITGNSNPAAGTASIIQVGGVQTLQFVAGANFVGTLTVDYTLSNAAATSAQATVNITVNPSRHTVGGTGSSALGPVTLQLTSTEAPQTLVVAANASSFTFPTGVLNNTAFQVAVTAKPSNQSCTVTPSSGTVAGAAITNLVLSCQTITAQNQSLALLAGTTGTVSLQTGATGGPFTGAAIVTPPAAAAGIASIIQVGGVQTLQFVAAPAYSGTTSLTYTLTSAVGTSAPATVTITVNPRPDPSLDADVVGLVRGEAETAKRFAATQISSFNERLEQLHNEGAQRQSTARLSVTGQSGSDVACQSSGDQVGDLTKRPDYNCAGNAGAVAGAAYADPRNATAYAAGATGTGASAAPAAASTAAGGTATPTNLAVWLGGYVNFGNNDNGTVNLNNTLVGVSGGVDYRFSPEFTAGIGLGYGHDKTAFGASSSRTLAEALSIAAYGSYRPSPGFYIDGLLGYSQLTYDSERFVTQNSLTARGSRDGDQIFGSISLGYEYRSPRDLLFATYGRLSGSSSTLDGFSETGAGIFNLVYAEQTVDSLSGTLGLRTEKAFALDNGTLTSRVRIEYSHDFEGSSLATLGYDDLGLLIYQIDAPAFSRNYLTLGLGFDAQFREGSTVGLSYNGSVGLNGDSVQHLVQLKFGVPF